VKKVLSIAVIACALTAATQASAAVAPGTAGQWHLDEGTGLTVTDSSGNGNNGVLRGGVTWVSGRFGSALRFDGGPGRVTIADNLALEPARAVTASAWVRSDGTPGDYRYVLAKGATGCIASSYGLYTGPAGGLEFYVSKGRGNAYVRSPDAGTGVWDGQWHLAVGTFDGSTVRLYVDGAQVGHGSPDSGSLEYALPDSNDFFIGDYPGCTQRSFSGDIDDVNVWRETLSAGTISSLYGQETATRTGGQTPVITGGRTSSSGTGTGSQVRTPVIRSLRLSPATFSLRRGRARRVRGRMPGTTISYTDTLAAQVTFRVLGHRSGIMRAGRCAAIPAHRTAAHAKRCTRTVALASFSRSDRGGHNTFRFTGVRGHRLAPGRYLLQATPRLRARNGRAVTAPFTLIP
jgi:Concanavalin A-like lectin/glucanases superfamily